MNILVITNAVWDNRNSYGNTISNWFENWQDSRFSCITYRSDIPNNKCCSAYYVISPFDVINKLFTPSKIGVRYDYKNLPTNYNKTEVGAKGIKGVKRYFIRAMIDILYKLPLWRNKRYKNFLKDIDSDVVFSFAIADSFIYENLKYIKEHSNSKIILFIGDDVYGAVNEGRDYLSRVEKKRLEKMFGMADKLYCASDLMAVSYAKLFPYNFFPLYKGCELQPLKTVTNSPVEIVYAGNLLYGRLDTLSTITSALRKINKNGVKMRLTVFSGTKVTDEQISCINDGASAVFAGQKPFEEVKKLLNHADITLHVESFEPQMQKIVRYSFSTKIIDCLQSGNTMLVVGPKNIASVEYPRRIPGAIVVDDTNKLHDELLLIISNPTLLIDSAMQTHAYAVKHHEIRKVRKSLLEDFKQLINE